MPCSKFKLLCVVRHSSPEHPGDMNGPNKMCLQTGALFTKWCRELCGGISATTSITWKTRAQSEVTFPTCRNNLQSSILVLKLAPHHGRSKVSWYPKRKDSSFRCH